MADKEPESWITVNGKHIPIGAGESKDEAIKKALAKDVDRKDSQIKANEAETKRVQEQHSEKGKADERTQQEHANVVKELSKDKYPDYNTYDISNLKTVEFDHGYQVTFCQIGDNYTPKEYATKVNECLAISSNGKTYGGKFEGTPEISFHCNSRKQAEEYARKNNQISIWDWKNEVEIKTGGTGRR